ncbi:MAG: N-formylglutamate amidohydrolase [Candidatus Thiodiazotropha endolucinida]|uniref:N-formylglutamate amidohydrolase n=1 Tax=Candidatus Thiodiazotropha taylori TaxID=2792791 RepID=A0A9E4TUW9_9GAMM|nr:N-formylglutamate amidohydrolase [Candidatus Thiodiazotropha taylori]MCW4238412.1 N-formylglutamate amidohydrolase [Candidatus Thiodiazotropha endolucinida]
MTVFHIPHSSTFIPTEYLKKLLLNDNELRSELLHMTDWHTDDLFSGDVSETDTVVKFGYSRLMVDPERFEDDTREQMTKVGMSVIYERTSDQRKLRNSPTTEEREELLRRYYRPHHARLHDAVSDELSKTDRSLIVDCHSFPSKALPYETDQESVRPDICIGTDNFHTPSRLAIKLKSVFEQLGYSVEYNRPFAGAIVPSIYYRCHPSVHSVMLEINRSFYINEATSASLTLEYQITKLHIASLLRSLN